MPAFASMRLRAGLLLAPPATLLLPAELKLLLLLLLAAAAVAGAAETEVTVTTCVHTMHTQIHSNGTPMRPTGYCTACIMLHHNYGQQHTHTHM